MPFEISDFNVADCNFSCLYLFSLSKWLGLFAYYLQFPSNFMLFSTILTEIHATHKPVVFEFIKLLGRSILNLLANLHLQVLQVPLRNNSYFLCSYDVINFTTISIGKELQSHSKLQISAIFSVPIEKKRWLHQMSSWEIKIWKHHDLAGKKARKISEFIINSGNCNVVLQGSQSEAYWIF